MKIFLFKRKTILIFFIIFILLISITYYFLSNLSLASKIDTKEVSSELINNINNIFNSKEKIAYLTFDDGPSPSVTPKILDILKEENIKATFFVIGKKVEEYPEIVNRAYKEGHFIANHTYSHNNSILYKDANSFTSEIQKTDLAIGNAIGIKDYSSHLFRFPNGFMSNIYKDKKNEFVKLLPNMDYTYIDWNALNKDSEKKYTKKQLLDNLISTSKNKNTLVILMHDTKDVSDSSLALKDSINYLKSQGYIFKNFYDLNN